MVPLVGVFASYLCDAPLDDISRILLFGGILGVTDPGELLRGLGKLLEIFFLDQLTSCIFQSGRNYCGLILCSKAKL